MAYLNDGYISQSPLQYLMATNDATAGRFYLLPKIHKKNFPWRPVISGCNNPTEKISAFGDSQLKPLTILLNKLKAMGRFPDGAILVTIDVVGLYPLFPMMKVLRLLEKLLTTDATQKFPQMISSM